MANAHYINIVKDFLLEGDSSIIRKLTTAAGKVDSINKNINKLYLGGLKLFILFPSIVTSVWLQS